MSIEPGGNDRASADHAGDPDFMTSLARGLAVIQAFRERRQHLSIAQISQRTRISRSAVGKRVLSVDLHVGSRLPAYCTSMGRVLLAALDEPALLAYLQGTQRVSRTRYTQYQEDALRSILQQVRQQGWCLVDQELEIGLRSIAVPVRDHAGNVVAAMQVSSHADRISCQEMITVFLPELMQASKAMMSQL